MTPVGTGVLVQERNARLMNRFMHQHVRNRERGRRRIGMATTWSAAAGTTLAAVFGVLFAQAGPAAATDASTTPVPAFGAAGSESGESAAAPDAATPAPTSRPQSQTRPRHKITPAPQLQAPAQAPQPSSGRPRHATTGAS